MLSGAIAYQSCNGKVQRRFSTILEKHPWYADGWRDDIAKLAESQRDEILFMLAARWADDIRTRDKAESPLQWHYIDFPFKPGSEPASIQAIEPPQENILTAIAEEHADSTNRE
jgi:hypothetical protein